MRTGLDRLLKEPALRRGLSGQRVGLLAHPASVTDDLTHGLDALATLSGIQLTAAFGPQHGLKGDKQDNMIESDDEIDPVLSIPIFSLYGAVRRPTDEMMSHIDVMLIDLQDLGCRIYTFVTTLLYILEEAAKKKKSVWVLDRPNPAGRMIEGLTLREGEESFVGAAPMPMRHGLTLGEMGHWFIRKYKLDVDYKVIEMAGWYPDQGPGFGWPLDSRSWVNPSPNAANLFMARAYAGTVLLEGTTLSEGRGTTRAMEVMGAPDIDAGAILRKMQDLAPGWLAGCRLRACWFEPVSQKHAGTLCAGFQIHTDGRHYTAAQFRPWRLVSLALKSLRALYPDYPIWRDFPYEYEYERLAIDVINGSPLLRDWVDTPDASPEDLDILARKDELAWADEIASVRLYGS